MTSTDLSPSSQGRFGWARGFLHWGIFWLLLAIIGAGIFFQTGIDALLRAWSLPEYSHGPLIPVLSGLMFLKQLKDYPPRPGPTARRWPGLVMVVMALLLGALGILSRVPDFAAYGLILWVGGILLLSFGWDRGKYFWPGIVHLVYMLPLPDTIYYKTTNYLQFVSSELGVYFLRLLAVPVFLDGNIIDLGVIKLHVAEACSGLRYMFPIMSFSYIFAILYRGPIWHKAVLLLAAVPIAILMNSVRIAIAGVIVQRYGSDWLEGFTHFFEGWVIFLACILILFALAWCMLFLRRDRLSLTDALDLDTSGLGPQAMRLQLVRPSAALIISALLSIGALGALQAMPERDAVAPDRNNFVLFPRTLGDWRQSGPRQMLSPQIEEVLGADDYHQVQLKNPAFETSVNLFMAWYDDQSDGGVHSPEVCLPGGGWEIAWLERTDITEVMGSDRPFEVNRAIIQQGETRMMVYYWFQQKDRRIAWDMEAKYWLMVDGIQTGRSDGALVRLTTMIRRDEPEEAADARLMDALTSIEPKLPNFIPEG